MVCVSSRLGANNCSFVASYSFPRFNWMVGLFYEWFLMRRKVEEGIAVAISN